MYLKEFFSDFGIQNSCKLLILPFPFASSSGSFALPAVWAEIYGTAF
jgi:hypothetical protein